MAKSLSECSHTCLKLSAIFLKMQIIRSILSAFLMASACFCTALPDNQNTCTDDCLGPKNHIEKCYPYNRKFKMHR